MATPDLQAAASAGALGQLPPSLLTAAALSAPNAAGNTALLGAKLALFSLAGNDGAYPELLAKVKHVSLNEDARFQETFVEEMVFPEDGA